MPRTVLSAPRILAQEVESSLYRKVFRLRRPSDALVRGLIYLSDGSAAVKAGDEARVIGAPALFWLSRSDGHRLVAEAGATGLILEITDEIVTRAVGDFSETAQLRFMVESDHCLILERKHSLKVAASLAAILEELHTPQSGSEMLMVAHLRVILVAMMRLAGAEEPQQSGAGTAAYFLQRFRQLLESNFRTQWPVSRYAGLIGISHDRLHAICRRELGKTPKALVAERLAREAGLGLERSTLSIEQLSHTLGFRDPAHFSHFFKRMTGMAPGAFRRLMAHPVSGAAPASPANFADWP